MAEDSGTIEAGQDNTVLGEFWPNFNVDGPYFDVSECAQVKDSMAVFTLEQFGIGIEYSRYMGGSLANIDIKRMDAMTVINQSLMEDFPSGGRLIEPIVNEEGKVEFVEIGDTANNGITDVYYTVQTKTYVDTAKGVMVTGGRPLPTRKKIEWKPIWGDDENSSLYIYTYVDMLNNCNKEAFYRYATITFNDPYLDSKYKDGIDNLFDIDNPWEQLLGYAHWKDVPEELVKDNDDYTINYSKTSTVPIKIGMMEGMNPSGDNIIVEKMANLGNIQLLPQFDPKASPADCWADSNQGKTVSFGDGIPVPIRTDPQYKLSYTNQRETLVDKFIKISGVYVIGVEIAYLKSAPLNDAEARKAQNGEPYEYNIWASIDDRQRKAFKLVEKRNYTVAYDPAEGKFKTPYIVFARDTLPNDPEEYGTNKAFYLYQGCKLARELNDATNEYTASILPLGKNRGILVEEIWALVDLDTPSVIINDPHGKAKEIAENFVYYLGALKIYAPPAPIGYAGVSHTGGHLVDQTTGVQDNDPTTAIDSESISELEELYDEMQGGGMALTLSFLDETNVADQAARLYKYMQYDGVSTVHTCGPCATPKLGRWGTTGVINSIQYSYSDKGSYTISVQEGPYIVGGLTPVDGGPTQKIAEDMSATGTIIKDVGNGIHFKVSIDGYGERWAISQVYNILRVGDVVSVTVHNNPVEA